MPEYATLHDYEFVN